MRSLSCLLPAFITVVCFSAAVPLYSQQKTKGLSDSTIRIIGTALQEMEMRQSDIWIPWDAVRDDPHRLKMIKNLFDEPLSSFDVVQYHASALKKMTAATADDYFASLCETLQLGEYKIINYENLMNAREIDERLQKGLDSTLTLEGAMLMRQYCAPFFLASEALNEARERFARRDILVRYCDSMLLQSEEDQSLNIYQLKKQEIEGLEISKKFFAQAAEQRSPELYAAGLAYYRTVLRLVAMSVELMPEYKKGINKTVIFETKYGRIALGGPSDDIYTGDFALIVDIGGNDRYFPSARTKTSAMSSPLRSIIDLEGNDIYIGGNYTFGGAIMGADIVYDAKGNDTYSAGNFSLGAGLFGVGILHDGNGNDRYAGNIFTQGAGQFGVGLLIDDMGNDVYNAQSDGQGFGGVRGFGALADKMGNDMYIASSPFQDFLRYDTHFTTFTQGAALGSRPIASGGIALLADYKGNDTYISDIYGQGTAYWFGLGALYDEDGDDRYQSYQYAQGSGVHFAHGILWDKNGEDAYVSHGVSQGCGHDIAFGALYDERGNDWYAVDGLSLGGGNANAISLFLDERGDDAYIARNQDNTMGYSDFRRAYGMIGCFVDAGGNDYYGSAERNNSVQTKSTYGVFADMAMTLDYKKQQTEPLLTPTDSLKDPLALSLDSLFIQASAAPQKYQYNVNPARERIIEKGEEAVQFIREQFGTESARERLALQEIIPKMYAKDTVTVRTMLLSALESDDRDEFSMAAAMVGRVKLREAAPILYNQFRTHDRWQIRALAAEQLGNIGVKEYADSLAQFLGEEHPHVKMRTVFSIGQLFPDKTLRYLHQPLHDTIQLIRNSAVQGIRKNAVLPLSFIREVFSPKTEDNIRRLLASVIYLVDTNDIESYETLINIHKQQPKSIRKAIYKSIPSKKTYFWKRMLTDWALWESDSQLRPMMPRFDDIIPTSKEKKKKKGVTSKQEKPEEKKP